MSKRMELCRLNSGPWRLTNVIWTMGALCLTACGDGDGVRSRSDRGGSLSGGDAGEPSVGGRDSIGGRSNVVQSAGFAGVVGNGGDQKGGTGGVANAATGGAQVGGAPIGTGSSGATTVGGAPAAGGAATGDAGASSAAQGGSGGNGGAAKGGTGGISTAGGVPTAGTTGLGAAGAAGTHCSAEADSFVRPSNAMPGCSGHFRMESLDRGVVAVKVSSGVYVGWRMSGCEYDPIDPTTVSYNVYREGTLIASVTDSTNHLDAGGTLDSKYTVRAVLGGVEQSASETATPWSQNYLRVPINLPAAGTVDRIASGQTDAGYIYGANDASTGDLDGDGRLDIVLKWDPSNSKDNSFTGFTGNVVIDAYELDATQLWRIDLGRNIRAGAHYTQFLVYDFDGDGKAEVAMKTAPGTKDGLGAYLHTGPAATDDDEADYRAVDGRVLSGPEYLTVFDGVTGAERQTVDFQVARSEVGLWGDTTGNRVDRFLASVGFVSDSAGGLLATGAPSLVMARGYYLRTTLTAWNWRCNSLDRIWTYDSMVPSLPTLVGQGAHSMAMADNQEGAQDVIYGAGVLRSDGTVRCSTGFGHGDALHVGDLVPSRSGLEVFMPHENGTMPAWDVHDAKTCDVITQGPVRGVDTGRGVAEDVSAANDGAEAWAGTGLVSATTGASLGTAPSTANHLIWWDADESRELLDNVYVYKYPNALLFSCSTCMSNNGTKANPALTADLLGDWREEVIWRENDNSALRIYTTTAVTARRIYTLMHDPQYRMQVSSQQTAYNQPPHTSFHIGNNMAAPPKPNIAVR